ncbi:hypothetical protein C0995_001612 [Termitomyces sp. Mi166|nr:hypothetical protein C0995_001612 [Termitomyces sp. Mi166\
MVISLRISSVDEADTRLVSRILFTISFNIVMLQVGGYILSYADAVTWARRRFPGIDIYDEDMIPNVIQRHNNKKLGGKIKMLATYKGGEALCILVTHCEDDPNAVRGSYDRFHEDEEAILLKRTAFTNREDFEKAKFVTVLDPFNVGY